jgi:hypothetical protein
MIPRQSIGKVIGVAAGATCAGLAAVFVLANPYRPATAEEAGLWIFIIPGIGAAGLLAAIAAVRRAARTLFVLFAISFFPFSLYLMLTPGIWRWFGVAELGYVVAAVLVRPRLIDSSRSRMSSATSSGSRPAADT